MRYSYNDFKRRKMALFCCNKTIFIGKRNNINSDCDFDSLNCFHLFRTKTKLDSHKEVSKNKLFLSYNALKTLRY